MHNLLRNRYQYFMQQAKQDYARQHYSQAFSSLEQAHVLGQRFLWPHLTTHWWMLKCGWRQQHRQQIVGQIWRLLAVFIGFVSGWLPIGNTGGTNVSALKPMPVAAEYQPLLQRYSLTKDIGIRLLLAIMALACWLIWHHR